MDKCKVHIIQLYVWVESVKMIQIQLVDKCNLSQIKELNECVIFDRHGLNIF